MPGIQYKFFQRNGFPYIKIQSPRETDDIMAPRVHVQPIRLLLGAPPYVFPAVGVAVPRLRHLSSSPIGASDGL